MKRRKSCLILTMFLLAFLPYYCFSEDSKLHVSASAQAWQEGKAECVMELDSRRIVYASNADVRLPMASTTKILTAITVLESCNDVTQKIEIPEKAVGVEGSSVYLKKGEVYSIELPKSLEVKRSYCFIRWGKH